ncbi:MAG: hypothetical protein HYU51_11725 [Candidatus Rokubacteria bacterium]|nr:hypothetical protein [Candidatus Rokubacteria bacterium]
MMRTVRHRVVLSAALLVSVVVLVAVVAPRPAHAAEWGAIVPGESTIEVVRARWGEPTRSEALKIESYDATQWVYEGDRAPPGIRRLTFEFGLLAAAGYQPDVVRIMRLEPNPGIFTRNTIVIGWGVPTRAGKDHETPVFFYRSGLLVEFDKEGWLALRMTFTPPQPEGGQ